MCVVPAKLVTGQLVGCRKCWQCKERRVADWVGRCIAESRTATGASVVTLTYGKGDIPNAAVLTYSDVQKFFKVLRKRGYPLKYFAMGEYGSDKGRAHWHIIIYWQGAIPAHVDRYGNEHGNWKGRLPKLIRGAWDYVTRAFTPGTTEKDPTRYFDPIWPHGHMVWDIPDASAIRYACKYLMKNELDGSGQYHLAMSKKPPIGAEYFEGLARRYVEQGLAPQDAFYSFPDVVKQDGSKMQFMMSGVTLDNFLKTYLAEWARQRPGCHVPASDFVEEWQDGQNRFDLEVENWASLFALAEERENDPRERYRKEHYDYYFGEGFRNV